MPKPEEEKSDETSMSSDGELDDDEELKLCETCYEEYPARKFFALECGHEFCKACMREHLKSNIMDGKVLRIPCMMANCDKEF